MRRHLHLLAFQPYLRFKFDLKYSMYFVKYISRLVLVVCHKFQLTIFSHFCTFVQVLLGTLRAKVYSVSSDNYSNQVSAS
jgi:hypothetical protein